jgi:alkaline phosphatase D
MKGKSGQKKSAPEKKEIKGILQKQFNRRGFLKASEKFFGVMAGIGFLGPYQLLGNSRNAAPTELPDPSYPFKLGVASGDPLPDSVVLWTRLAPDPLTTGGGMTDKRVQVNWEISEDDSFRKVIKRGTETAYAAYAHSVHAEVDGLSPNKHYFYRFKAGNHVSHIGRTKTAPALDAEVGQLNSAFLSCQSYPAGYYTAYEHLVKEDLDVVFFLGDYIYEGKMAGRQREHIPNKAIYTLDEYRIRYGQYKSDPSLKAAHAAFPWIVTHDDHEVKNNWGGDGSPFDTEEFLARRAAAFQAYYEHMPLRKSSIPENIQMSLFRKFTYGNLVEFNVLDTRQYRSGPACGGRNQNSCEERLDPSRTMLGDEQEKWLFNSLKSSSTHWNVLAQQVIMAQKDNKAGPGATLGMDKWDGYFASRERLFNIIKENDISNLIVLTGDSHQNWVNDLKEDFNDPGSAVLATEFGGTSVSSGGNGTDLSKGGRLAMAENPHIKFSNAQRGYVLCRITPEKWQIYFRVLPYIDKPGAPISTRASFVVEKGKPGAVEV